LHAVGAQDGVAVGYNAVLGVWHFACVAIEISDMADKHSYGAALWA